MFNRSKQLKWVVVALAIFGGLEVRAMETDPGIAPMPMPGFATDERAMVIFYRYDEATPGALVQAILSQVPPSQRISAAPHLEITLLDNLGQLMDLFHVDYPSWVRVIDPDGGESKQIQQGRVGRFNFPFSAELKLIRIRDLDSGDVVLEIPSEPLFQQFCSEGALGDAPFCQSILPEDIFKSGFE